MSDPAMSDPVMSEPAPRRVPDRPDAIKTVGIVGSGQMGAGIAHVFALAGYSVVLNDLKAEQLEKALENIDKNLARQVSKNIITAQQAASARERLTTSMSLEPIGGADLVVESATENEAIKHKIFESVTPYLKPETILTTNTSSISITRLAASTDRPGRFMGLHFMNPVPLMQLVELIRGIATEEDTFATMKTVVASLDKTVASAEDFPAFIVNRILLPMINEAVYTLYEGVGTVEAIDTAMRLGANHPMGPLQLADFIGLDTCLAIMNVLHDGLADTKYRPCPLMVKYVEAGWLGRKAGRGFYDYRSGEPIPTR